MMTRALWSEVKQYWRVQHIKTLFSDIKKKKLSYLARRSEPGFGGLRFQEGLRQTQEETDQECWKGQTIDESTEIPLWFGSLVWHGIYLWDTWKIREKQDISVTLWGSIRLRSIRCGRKSVLEAPSLSHCDAVLIWQPHKHVFLFLMPYPFWCTDRFLGHVNRAELVIMPGT